MKISPNIDFPVVGKEGAIENQPAGIYAVEHVLKLVLDCFPESMDSLGACNFHLEDIIPFHA